MSTVPWKYARDRRYPRRRPIAAVCCGRFAARDLVERGRQVEVRRPFGFERQVTHVFIAMRLGEGARHVVEQWSVTHGSSPFFASICHVARISSHAYRRTRILRPWRIGIASLSIAFVILSFLWITSGQMWMNVDNAHILCLSQRRTTKYRRRFSPFYGVWISVIHNFHIGNSLCSAIL